MILLKVYSGINDVTEYIFWNGCNTFFLLLCLCFYLDNAKEISQKQHIT